MLNGAGNMQLSKHSYSINADLYVLRGSKKNLSGISELRQIALNDENDDQCNGTSGFNIQGNNDSVIMLLYTNAVSACAASTGSKKSDAVAFPIVTLQPLV